MLDNGSVSSERGDVKPSTGGAEPETESSPAQSSGSSESAETAGSAEVTDSVDEQAEQALPPRRVAVLAIVAPLALAIDIISKVLVVAYLEAENKPPLKLLGGLVYFDVIRNSGAAFSMATGMTWILSLVAVAVVVALIIIAPRLRSTGWAIGLGLVLAGALGNLLDRIFRAPGPLRGYVVDFISLFWPNGEHYAVFNFADSCICVGGALIVVMAILGRDYDGGVSRRRRLAEQGAVSRSSDSRS
jgi:signal peptidase II